jgi:periodic tryptophan protein 2
MTSPTPTQFTCVHVTATGDLVCAGTMEPYNLYLWALKTGDLLDVFTGHSAPVSAISFAHLTVLTEIS